MSPNKPLLQVASVMVFYHSNRTLRQYPHTCRYIKTINEKRDFEFEREQGGERWERQNGIISQSQEEYCFKKKAGTGLPIKLCVQFTNTAALTLHLHCSSAASQMWTIILTHC